jgi:hypothetical protein
MLPTFLVTGGARCGTTYLFELLRQNHHLYLNQPRTNDSITKDTYFFSHTCYRNRSIDINDYAKHFINARPEQIVGEVATSYDFFPWVPGLINKYLTSKIRLIFLVRNPIQRAYAHYMLSLIRGNELYRFETAIKKEAERLIDTDPNYLYNLHHYSYVARGFYMRNIDHYLSHFPKRQIKIISSEALYNNPKQVYREICEFLEVEVVSVDFQKNRNNLQLPLNLTWYRFLKFIKSSMYNKPLLWRISVLAKKTIANMPKNIKAYPPINPLVIKQLSKVYNDDIKELSAFVDLDFFDIWNIK